MTHETLHSPHGRTLTPAERQIVLRRLKFGPVLSREELTEYTAKISREVIAERNKKEMK
jgi:hypothetical protein